MRILSRIALALLVMLAAGAAFAQDTGSIRGTVTDTTGAVVPGATVTLQNEATRFTRNVVTDAKGDYYFGAVSPGVYTITVEIPGFKMSSRKGMRDQPARGRQLRRRPRGRRPDREDRGHRPARDDPDGDRRPRGPDHRRADREPLGRRPQPARAAAHPARLGHARRQLARERRQPDRRLQHQPGRPVRRQRHPRLEHRGHPRRLAPRPTSGRTTASSSSRTTTWCPRSRSSPRTTRPSSARAGVQVNAITKGGSSEFHGTVYDYIRHYHFQANDRSNSITGTPRPKSKFQYPGGNLSGPILIPGTDFNKNRDKAFFFFGLEVQRQQVDNGSQPGRRPDRGASAPATSASSSANSGSNLPGHDRQHPGRVPRRRHRRLPNNNLAPYIDPIGQMLMNLYPAPNYNDPRQPLQLRVQQARAAEPPPDASCASTTTSPRTRRPTSAWPGTARRWRRPAACGGTPRATTCRAPSATERWAGRSRRT